LRTYDPYAEISRPDTGFFVGLPSAPPGTVLVVDREGHPLRTLLSHSDRLTAGESRFGRIRTLYKVDVREQALEFKQTFPCADDIGGFHAEVQLICRVEKPDHVVRRGIHDVATVLVPLVEETLGHACRNHAAEEHLAAEEDALRAVRMLENAQRHDGAFRITQITLKLRPDEAAAEFIRRIKQHKRTSATQEGEARLEAERASQQASKERTQAAHEALLDQEREQHEAERAVMVAAFELQRAEEQAALNLERERLEAERETQGTAIALNRAAQEAELAQARALHDAKLALQMDQLEAERARQAAGFEQERLLIQQNRDRIEAELRRQQLDLELKQLELEQERARLQLEGTLRLKDLEFKHIVSALHQGDYGVLALQLQQNPDSIEQIVAMLAQDRQVETVQRMQALKVLTESGAVEGWEVSNQAKAMLTQLIEIWGRNQTPEVTDGSGPTIEVTVSDGDTNGVDLAEAPPFGGSVSGEEAENADGGPAAKARGDQDIERDEE
jgi:hypothetical protein